MIPIQRVGDLGHGGVQLVTINRRIKGVKGDKK